MEMSPRSPEERQADNAGIVSYVAEYAVQRI